jgi:hypothetical protein
MWRRLISRELFGFREFRHADKLKRPCLTFLADQPLRLFFGRPTASFLRRSFFAGEEWFRAANPDAFRLEERPTDVALPMLLCL